MTQSAPSIITAFVFGILSFLTPCVLPLVPGYISFMSGQSLKELRASETSRRSLVPVLVTSLAFIAGFSTVFVALGATATLLGQVLGEHRQLLLQAAGVVVVILGLHMAGAFRIAALYKEARFQGGKAGGPLEAFVLGLAFALGWTPCVGPILGGILGLAMREEHVTRGIVLLVSYSLGMAVPFFLTGLMVDTFFSVFDKVKVHFRKIEIASGVLLVLMGLLMATNNFTYLKIIFEKIIPESIQRMV